MMVISFREGEIDAGTETNSNLYHEVYYHFLGTDQSEDILCWKDSDNPKHLFGASVTEDGRVIMAFFGLMLILLMFRAILFSSFHFSRGIEMTYMCCLEPPSIYTHTHVI